MNLSNKLTISRIFLTFVFIFLMNISGVLYKIGAVLIFSLACMTDYFDGYLARRKGEVTIFGKLMDPIADKILVISAFIAFSRLGLVEVWMVIIILLREFIVTSLRIFTLARGKIIEAHRLGKHKTISSYVAIFLILVFLIFKEIATQMNFYSESFKTLSSILIYILMLMVIIFTVTSGISYIAKNAFLLRDSKK
jgi:CDP-diacylglycerol--glycerol-3-phosphate 3-phosphatidyltransferase